jgi:hypothetical protein
VRTSYPVIFEASIILTDETWIASMGPKSSKLGVPKDGSLPAPPTLVDEPFSEYYDSHFFL